MINTERPLVIYDHMRIALDTVDLESVSLEHSNCEFRLYGKRGDVALNFNFFCNGEKVGKGQKKMLISGLREYNQEKIDALVNSYTQHKETYLANHKLANA